MELIQHKNKWYIKSDTGYREVVASTDPKLMSTKTSFNQNFEESYVPLPQIPQSFIESYVKNPVEEVELEYEHNDKTKPTPIRAWSSVYRYKLVNNEVVVVEPYYQTAGRMERIEQLYTREEVEKLCRSAFISGENAGFTHGPQTIEQWLKENL